MELPAISPLPRRRCFAPTKIFHLMYPKINYITGFALAPVNVSGYAELGLGYALIATVICGAIIGMLAFFARGRGPLSVSVGVVACIYAYYVSQVSLIGSLVATYGLFWLLSPLVVIAVIDRLSEALVARSRRSAHCDMPSA